MKMDWFRYRCEIVNCELRERLKRRRRTARVKKDNAFFFCVYTIVPFKPNRFGSVGVFPVSDFWNRNRTEPNRTEPKIFTKILIGFFLFGFFGYFFLGFFCLIGFSVFLLTPSLHLLWTWPLIVLLGLF